MNEDMMKLAEEYATVAQNLLEDQGEPYTEEDIAKVAEFLIENDYPSEDGDENFDKLAEQAFMAGFEDELEKQAMKNPNQLMREFAAWLSAKAMGSGTPHYFNAQGLPKWKARTRISNWIDSNPLKAGYGAVGLGAAAAGGAGYAGYRAMKKEGSYFEKQAMRNPNQLMRELAAWLSAKAMGSGTPHYFNAQGLPKWKARTRISNWIDSNPLKAGYGAVGLGAAAAGGAGYAGYRALRRD